MEEALKKNLFIFNKKEIPSMEFVRELILTMKDNVDLIIIDHLHYIHMDADTETREIGRIMRELKIITDIIKKPIVLISHMRKRPNKEKDEDPTLNDLY
jgi:replicative DNA helicase